MKSMRILPLPIFLFAAGLGVLWPIAYFIHPRLGTGMTVLSAIAVSVFLYTMPIPDDEALPWKDYLLNGFLLGLTMLVVNFLITRGVCLVWTGHQLCDPRVHLVSLMLPVFFLYAFTLVMVRFLIQ